MREAQRAKRHRLAIPRAIFKEMRLGEYGWSQDKVRVVGGIARNWWDPFALAPVIVAARIITRHK